MNYTLVNDIIEKNFIHKNDKIVYEHTCDETIEFSQDEFRNDCNNEEDFKRICGRQWKKNLATLIAMVDIYKYIAGRNKIYALPISQNGALADVYKSQQNVCSALKLAKKVDLIKCVDETYQFNAYYEDMNKAKMYIFNKKVQDLVIFLANKYSIIHKVIINKISNNNNNNKNNNIIYNSTNLREFNVKINSNLRLSIPKATDEQLDAYLEEVYPQYHDYKVLANEINQEYYYDEPSLAIRFMSNIHRSKGGLVTKIGLRATNSICSAKDHITNKETRRLWRKDILEDYFGKDNYIEYDVKSSIYRINHFLNYKVWLDNSIDLYTEMYGKEFDSKEQRDMYKNLAMSIYFDNSIGKLWTHLTNKASELKNYDKTMLQAELNELRKQMTDVIGETFDSEIFLHESCIYMDLCHELLKQGFKVIQVYDGFYVDKKISQDDFIAKCNELLDDISIRYYNKYINNISIK